METEKKTLVAGISDWDFLFETVYVLGDAGGLTETQVEHIQDMLEYRPAAPKHIRTMDIFLAEGGDAILEFQAYGTKFEIRFTPNTESLAIIKHLEGMRQ